MNSKYENNKDVISFKGIGASEWRFNIQSNEFFCNDEVYNKEQITGICCYNNLLKNVHCDDVSRVEDFFKGIKYESINEASFDEIIFKFRNNYGELIKIFARSIINIENPNIREGYFFNISNVLEKSNNEGFLSKNREELIKGIFIVTNKYDGIVSFYGNNKDIIGLDNICINMNFNDCIKYIHKDYIKEISTLINNPTQSIYEGLEIKINDIYGKEKWISLKGRVKRNSDGSLIGFEGYIDDITNEKEANIKLKYISNYDELTGVHNRGYLKQIIEDYITKHKENESRGSLIIIDLDNFKFINDSYGHRCGDLFIEAVAYELEKISEDKELICRFGGDEFLIFIPNITSLVDVEKMANKIIHRFKDAFYIEENEIYSTVSIGTSIFPDDGVDFEELLKNADAAMYIAKSNGKNQYQFFNYNISHELNKIYTIQKGLRTALDKGEMFVVFQPKVELNNDKTGGFEALLRWKSEELGFVSPVEFIPIAETTRLIIPIGNFVLEEVCSKIKYLLKEGYDNFKIALNLSEVQLRDRTLVNTFKTVMEMYDISPKYIEIEITESMLMKSFDKNIEALLEIKALGVSIALDDFGTGYSSLNYLTKLPIDVLKIDRSFVVDMIDNHKSRCIVENIIQLSHKLGIKVVAEGVEVIEQVDYLKSIYCDIVQGYYYSKPQVFENVINMLPR
ncbi:putative bifunctional diguanylate cyclase/phosphodiesterase [Clostridium gasigenes]|uniref:Diguanylate cyclase (GGDEF) domain-containing protein n=1 Tax=Clostridium gasigenes TaxID=94869 RepID=A0A1H0UQZ8_9CLOT|nr:EAL domain-containing protein [Clostridium gasigenes]MBU3132227.1 EAL domain-containing protein [Clostridium gasigenes]MBU3136048.1 EAL domain-containing protein [Clostridium gasigenes]SDP68530.1 diguanylate cyclase (GGDEF) domain-containing protein [Clostridium gasigenes]